MKRNFLILSALLTVVFGAALLQSCSADDDSYTTEEYGYYTAEEIDAIKALGEKYGISVTIDETTYEIKKTLEEFEEDIKMHASMLGEYELVPAEGGLDGEFIARKKGVDIARSTTRAAESGSWGHSFTHNSYNLSITINWKYPSNIHELGVASGELKATRNALYYYGSLNCSMGSQGTDTVTFSGSIILGIYRYYLTQGRFSISTNSGSFLFDDTPYQKPPTVRPTPEPKPVQ